METDSTSGFDPHSIPSCRYANALDGAAVGVSRRLTALYVYPGSHAHEGGGNRTTDLWRLAPLPAARPSVLRAPLPRTMAPLRHTGVSLPVLVATPQHRVYIPLLSPPLYLESL